MKVKINGTETDVVSGGSYVEGKWEWPVGSVAELNADGSIKRGVSRTAPMTVGFYAFAGGGVYLRFNVIAAPIDVPAPVDEPLPLCFHPSYEPNRDKPELFAPILKANGFTHVRLWSQPHCMGNFKAWRENGIKVILTVSFSENLKTIHTATNAPAYFKSNFKDIVKRLEDVDIVQFWNEPQYGEYTPKDCNTDAGFRLIFDTFYEPLSKAVGKQKMATPSVTPHFGMTEIVARLSKVGFYDSNLASFADVHPYFYPNTTEQQIDQKFKELRQITQLPLIATECNVKGGSTTAAYTVKHLQPQLAVVRRYVKGPLAYFISVPSTRHAKYPPIWKADGKVANQEILDMLKLVR